LVKERIMPPSKKKEETAPQPASDELVINDEIPATEQRQNEGSSYIVSRRLREARERGEELGPRPESSEPSEKGEEK
jgi:hypothetical protein